MRSANNLSPILSQTPNGGIYLQAIGGWSEHLHLLISLGRERTIAKATMLIKGESSRWLSQQDFFRGKFFWQDDYFALSVSESLVEKVKTYIQNQEEHHRAIPFRNEYDRFKEIADGPLG